ncbi:MAG: DNA repair protein RecN [Bacteroidales bacterium]|nr:DNA repair protein RecN [Bacteroidales bacterium]
MLTKLTISNYALIDALDIEVPGNLVIISGETGAGKSILLGALSLLLGGRADVSVIRDRNRNCVVEAEFEDIIIRRVVSPSGRSRAFVNDEPVSLDELKRLGSSLVDIHSQHSHLLLGDEHFQISVLDCFAGNGDLKREYLAKYREYLECCAQLNKLDTEIAAYEKERDYIEFQYNKLEEARLVPGELEEMEKEQNILANAEEIGQLYSQVGDSFENEAFSVEKSLKEIGVSLERLKRLGVDTEELVQRVESSRIELKDIRDEVEARSEKVVKDPIRLSVVDDRIALITELMRKFGKESVEELMEYKDSLAEKLSVGIDFGNTRNTVAAKCESLDNECDMLADKLSQSRKEAAPKLSEEIRKSAVSLEMPFCVFRVEVGDAPTRGEEGKNTVSFMFSANGEHGVKELGKCASGGEMSRIMLCIKELLARYTGMPTLVFDEIDTGVSGSVAAKMGQMTVKMGENMQVIAITHLPQVASRGSSHFVVKKTFSPDGGATTSIGRVEGDERVREIARMLSGENLTAEAVENAKVLLNE